MILDLAYISKDLYKSNLVRSRPIYSLGLGVTNLYIRDFCYLVNVLIDKADILISKKS